MHAMAAHLDPVIVCMHCEEGVRARLALERAGEDVVHQAMLVPVDAVLVRVACRHGESGK